MLLLGIDTSAAVSACVHDGTSVLAEAFEHDPRRHAELLAPMITDVLARAGVDRVDLTDVVVGSGPGPFTGLRVGLVTARTLGLALDVGVHGVCSLDALAAEALASGVPGLDGGFLVATDARRREVYWACYDAAGRRVNGPHVGPAAEVERAGLPTVGRGAQLYSEALPGPDGHEADQGPLDPRASFVATLAAAALAAGETETSGGVLMEPEPLYLRRPDAVEPGRRKPVLS